MICCGDNTIYYCISVSPLLSWFISMSVETHLALVMVRAAIKRFQIHKLEREKAVCWIILHDASLFQKEAITHTTQAIKDHFSNQGSTFVEGRLCHSDRPVQSDGQLGVMSFYRCHVNWIELDMSGLRGFLLLLGKKKQSNENPQVNNIIHDS